MSDPGFDSAVLVPVPEAEPFAYAWRERLDPSAWEGVPAHVTTLAPFVPAAEIDDATLRDLRSFFGSIEPFRFALTAVRRFPDTVWLTPEPAEPFRGLTETLYAHYPGHPPYGGIHDEVIPHLSLAHTTDETVIAHLEAGLSLPIEAVAREAWLMTRAHGWWTTRAVFPFLG